MDSLMQKSEYEDMYYSEDKLWWYRGLRGLLKYYVNRFADKDAKILDAGCGTGKNYELLKELGYKNINAFDYSEDALDFCKNRGLENIELGSVTNLSYPDKHFDVVLCMDVIGCLDSNDRESAAKELTRVLKPGGILILNSAALEFLRSQHDDVCNVKIRFKKEQMRDLFANKNIEFFKLSYRVFLLFPLIFIFKIIKKLTKGFSKESSSDQTVFPFGINWVLTKIQLLENFIFQYINFPVGSSIFMVARKK